MTNPNPAPNGTTAAVAAPPPARSSEQCSNCLSKKGWVLHNVRYRATLRRLCTSCVLRLHPASFCPVCFLTHHQNPQNTPNQQQQQQLVSCSNCPSLSHPDCLPPYAAFSPAPHRCPACTSASHSYFNLLDKTLDKRLAPVLLCAATIAAASMSKAAAIARLEAEKKVKEAAAARKRAREALDRFVVLSGGQTKPPPPAPALTNGVKADDDEEQKVKPEQLKE